MQCSKRIAEDLHPKPFGSLGFQIRSHTSQVYDPLHDHPHVFEWKVVLWRFYPRRQCSFQAHGDSTPPDRNLARRDRLALIVEDDKFSALVASHPADTVVALDYRAQVSLKLVCGACEVGCLHGALAEHHDSLEVVHD